MIWQIPKPSSRSGSGVFWNGSKPGVLAPRCAPHGRGTHKQRDLHESPGGEEVWGGKELQRKAPPGGWEQDLGLFSWTTYALMEQCLFFAELSSLLSGYKMFRKQTGKNMDKITSPRPSEWGELYVPDDSETLRYHVKCLLTFWKTFILELSSVNAPAPAIYTSFATAKEGGDDD